MENLDDCFAFDILKTWKKLQLFVCNNNIISLRLVRECAQNLHLKLAQNSRRFLEKLQLSRTHTSQLSQPNRNTSVCRVGPSGVKHRLRFGVIKIHVIELNCIKAHCLERETCPGQGEYLDELWSMSRCSEARVASDFCFLSQGFQSDAAAFASIYAQVWKTCFKSRLVLPILMHGLKSSTTFPHWQACKNNSQDGRHAGNMLRGPRF